jgi:hypothetical protein
MKEGLLVIVLLWLGFIFLWILIVILISLATHYRSREEILNFKQMTLGKGDFAVDNLLMKFYRQSAYKSYWNLISGCNLQLSTDYLVIMPFQTFPFKAYHKPILFIKKLSPELMSLGISDCYKPDKIIFKQIMSKEIEIRYSEKDNKFQLRIQNIPSEVKEKLAMLESWQ